MVQFSPFFRRSIVATAVVAALFTGSLAAAAPASATQAPTTSSITAITTKAVTADHEAASATPVSRVLSINSYGCAGLVAAANKSLYVAAFVLGYCPSVYVLQGTAWGRAFVNSIVNGACRIPWLVRAATNGHYSTC